MASATAIFLGVNSTRQIVALTGFMAAGKTSVGAEVARLLGWTFVDLDEAVTTEARMRIPEIFSQRGEAAFRDMESATLERRLQDGSDPLVLALGGGTLLRGGNRALLAMAEATVVHLEVSLSDVKSRNPDTGRPLFDPQRLESLLAERAPGYASAEFHVDTSGKSVAEVAQQVAALVVGAK